MAEPFETLREVGVAISGIKEQLATYAKVFGAVVVLALAVVGFLYSKIDKIEDGVSRNTAILERIERAMNDVASNTSEIKDAVQTAAVAPDAPSPSLIPGWKGVPLADFGNLEDLQIAVGAQDGVTSSKAWVYIPAE